MLKNIFITATNTGIGKTYATVKLIKILSQIGIKVGVFKPIETGVSDSPLDGSLLLKYCSIYNHNFTKISIDKIVPYQFSLPAAPYVAKGKTSIDMDKIFKAYKEIASLSDIVLIEGAGGLMVPIEKDFFMIDLIEFFKAKALLVTHDKLGCINDTLLSLKALDDRGLEHIWCINLRNKEKFNKETLPFYKEYFGKVLYLEENLKEIALSLIADSDGYRYFS